MIKIHPEIKRLTDIPGIGDVGSVKIISRIVDAHRFASRNHFLSYCGLIKLEKISGGKSYGKKNPRYCRMMKCVFKTTILASMLGHNQFSDQYEYMLNEKNLSDRQARSAVTRSIATVVFGVMKSGKKYDPLMNIKLRREKKIIKI